MEYCLQVFQHSFDCVDNKENFMIWNRGFYRVKSLMCEHSHALLAPFHMWEQPLSVSIFSVLPSCLVKRHKSRAEQNGKCSKSESRDADQNRHSSLKGSFKSRHIWPRAWRELTKGAAHAPLMRNKQKTPWVIIASESIMQVIKMIINDI